jgi:hypothetical protein
MSYSNVWKCRAKASRFSTSRASDVDLVCFKLSPDSINTLISVILHELLQEYGCQQPGYLLYKGPTESSISLSSRSIRTATMKNIASSLFVATAVQSVALAAPAGQDEPMSKRLENGLGRTPALGYNNWVRPCIAHIINFIDLLI